MSSYNFQYKIIGYEMTTGHVLTETEDNLQVATIIADGFVEDGYIDTYVIRVAVTCERTNNPVYYGSLADFKEHGARKIMEYENSGIFGLPTEQHHDN